MRQHALSSLCPPTHANVCVSFMWGIFMQRWIIKSHWIHPGVPLDIGIIIFNTFMQMLFVHWRECCIFPRTEDCYITGLWRVNCKSFPVWCEVKRRMKTVMVSWLLISMKAWTIQLLALQMPRSVRTGLNGLRRHLGSEGTKDDNRPPGALSHRETQQIQDVTHQFVQSCGHGNRCWCWKTKQKQQHNLADQSPHHSSSF